MFDWCRNASRSQWCRCCSVKRCLSLRGIEGGSKRWESTWFLQTRCRETTSENTWCPGRPLLRSAPHHWRRRLVRNRPGLVLGRDRDQPDCSFPLERALPNYDGKSPFSRCSAFGIDLRLPVSHGGSARWAQLRLRRNGSRHWVRSRGWYSRRTLDYRWRYSRRILDYPRTCWRPPKDC